LLLSSSIGPCQPADDGTAPIIQSWRITGIGSTTALREGTAHGLAQAWAQAVGAVMDQLTASELDRCAIVVDGPPTLLIAGRSDAMGTPTQVRAPSQHRRGVLTSFWVTNRVIGERDPAPHPLAR
jgi:hypothetical protein